MNRPSGLILPNLLSRCRRLLRCARAALFLLVAMLAPIPGTSRDLLRSQDEPDVRAESTRVPDQTQQAAMGRGLEYLRIKQSATGSFAARYPVAVTALAGMAFLGAGHEYGRGPYGGALVRAVEYLVSKSGGADAVAGYVNDNRERDESRMHGHAYAILFLSQVVGTIDNPRAEETVRRVIQDGIGVIERSQTEAGGWGYFPGDPSDEASITVCCLQALRAAKDAGFEVDVSAIRGALRYLKNCAMPDGSFRYSIERGETRSSYELTAAAVSTLHAAGEYTNAEHAAGVEFLRRKLAPYRKKPLDACDNYPHYGNLYAAQVFFQLRGADWQGWWERARDQIMREQKDDGRWESRFGDEYGTAMSLLILEVPMGYLPIFER